MHTWRITRRPGAWPRWGLIEDVAADYLIVEDNGQQRLILYQRRLVIGQPRDVVVQRLHARDVIEIRPLCSPPHDS